jgi:hypothetical protein
MATTHRIETDYGLLLQEWVIDETDTDPPLLVIGPCAAVEIQVMEMLSGTPTIGMEGSLSREGDALVVWYRLRNALYTEIVLTAPGGHVSINAPYMVRPRVVAGTGSARVRIKASRGGGV